MTTTCMLKVYCLHICKFVFIYVIKLGTMSAIWTIPPAVCSSGKQNIQFQNKIDWQ